MTVHIIGGGIAGLAAATAAAASGAKVVVYEAAGQPGGRCRSFFSDNLGAVVDNGAHVVLGCNGNALDYLVQIGARDGLISFDGIPFADLTTGARWTVPGRIPGATLGNYLGAWRLFLAGAATTAGAALPPSPLFDRLWRPLCVAALNTPPDAASARLLAQVVRRMFRGAAASRVFMAADSLSATFIEPALRFLARAGGAVRTNTLCDALALHGDRAAALRLRHETVPLDASDSVIVAVPPWSPLAQQICPDATQLESAAIVNAHFRLEDSAPPSMTGLTGGTAHWLFVRGGVATATVSAADGLMDMDAAEIATLLWRDIAPLLKAGPHLPHHHVIKERRATLVHSPEQEALRPGPATACGNVVLAGDWTATGLPCTIDGAVAAGRAAWAATRR